MGLLLDYEVRILEAWFYDDLENCILNKEITYDVGPVVSAYRNIRKNCRFPNAGAIDHLEFHGNSLTYF